MLGQVHKALLTGQSWLRADINLQCDGERTHEETEGARGTTDAVYGPVKLIGAD